jgi:hypothetical protein
VWWPGVDENSKSDRHPLIYDSTGAYGEDALDRLAEEFAIRPPESLEELSPQEQAIIRLRSFPSTQANSPALLVPLATRRDLRRLTTELRRIDRDYPIVVLTLGATNEPMFAPSAIRPALDPHVPVYVLGSTDLCRRLQQAFGPRLGVDNGDARVYWPDVGRDGDPAKHPLVPAHSERDGRDPADRLIDALELSRPRVRDHVAMLRKRQERAEQQASDAQRELRDTRIQVDTLLTRAEDAERGRSLAEQRLAALRTAGLDQAEVDSIASMDSDARLRRLMMREWLRALPTPTDREKYPLRYVFGSRFIKSVDALTGTSLERVAWVCAMVASGRAKDISGIEPHQLRTGRSGGTEQQVRSDGAKA